MANESNLHVLKTIELKSSEKISCLHGNWSSITHIAHFSQTSSSILTERIDYIIKQLLKKHPRLRSRIRILRSVSTTIFHPQVHKPYVDEQHLLDIFDYDEEFFSRNDILQNLYSIYQNDNNWMKLTEDLANKNPYNEDLTYIFPLFHFMLILNQHSDDNCHLILLTNHAVSDGRSGYIILHDYLTLATQNECIEWEINRNVPPDLLELLQKPYRLIYPLISKLFTLLFLYNNQHMQTTLPCKSILLNPDHPNDHRYPIIQPARTHFLFTTCSKNHYERLRQICHEQHLTLHGPLFACLILATQYIFFPIVDQHHFEADILVNLDIGVNYDMRKRLSSNISLEETVGSYVGSNSIDLSKISLKMKFWSFADYCYKETHKKLTSGELSLITHGYADIIDDKRNFFYTIGNSTSGFLSEMVCSNIGKYPYNINEYKNLHLDGIHVASTDSIYHSSAILYLTCVKQIDISLAHRFENLDKAKEFLDLYKTLMELSIDFSLDITLEDIFDLLNKT